MSNTSIELKVPSVGESVTEVEIAEWLKKEGDLVTKDENILVLETDKATMEIPAPVSGRLTKLLCAKGDRVKVDDTVAVIETGAAAAPVAAAAPAAPAAPAEDKSAGKKKGKAAALPEPEKAPAPAPAAVAAKAPEAPAPVVTAPVAPAAPAAPAAPKVATAPVEAGDRSEEVVPMSLLRRKIAENLVAAQHNGALLTTFNEVDMSGVMALRKENQERFLERYQVKLGFMSFFVKATVEALKEYPGLNAEIRGTNIVYKNYQDIGVAIGGGRGLVVPVLRNTARMSFADIERAIAEFGKRAKENKIRPEDLTGGTFTITNGGVYGSLLSTPLVNPPQSGVLGMHGIVERPIAIAGQVVVRPMMYIALTYDHRLVDGREAVLFLRRIKELVENPVRILIEI